MLMRCNMRIEEADACMTDLHANTDGTLVATNTHKSNADFTSFNTRYKR
jgi:hypothetical protein